MIWLFGDLTQGSRPHQITKSPNHYLNQWFGFLRLVRMFGTRIDEEFFNHCPAQFGFWQHAVDAMLDDILRLAVEQVTGSFAALTTGVAGVAEVFFLVNFFAGETHLLGIDDDDEVAGVHVGREGGLVLAPQYVGNFGEKATRSLPFRIHNEPLARHLFFFCRGSSVA